MKTSIKILILALSAVIVTSCFDDGDDTPPRTEADELLLLNAYLDTLDNRGVDVDTTDLGVYYVIDSVGSGPYPTTGDTCIVKYDLRTIGGYLIDASSRHSTDGNYEFVLDKTQMIKGWNDGIKHIREGSIAYLIIPSKFGYGANVLLFDPYETLIFKIEVVEIKQAY